MNRSCWGVSRRPSVVCNAASRGRKFARRSIDKGLPKSAYFGDNLTPMLHELAERARAPKIICVPEGSTADSLADLATQPASLVLALRSSQSSAAVEFSSGSTTFVEDTTQLVAARAQTGLSASSSDPVGAGLVAAVNNPSKLDFHNMYKQLEAWTKKHKSSHVPRKCWDAPVLGSWVWWLRRAKKKGELFQWQVDLVSKLDFDWVVDMQESKWLNDYHHLRRYKHVHGTAYIPPDFKDPDDEDFSRVASWLQKQAKMFAKDRLSAHRVRMLELLGVELKVDETRIQRHAQLQGLNAMERRQLRRKWKKEREQDREVRQRKLDQQQAVQQLEARKQADAERLKQFQKLLGSGQQSMQYIGGVPVKVRT